jgi:excisionase family DNA binding protein
MNNTATEWKEFLTEYGLSAEFVLYLINMDRQRRGIQTNAKRLSTSDCSIEYTTSLIRAHYNAPGTYIPAEVKPLLVPADWHPGWPRDTGFPYEPLPHAFKYVYSKTGVIVVRHIARRGKIPAGGRTLCGDNLPDPLYTNTPGEGAKGDCAACGEQLRCNPFPSKDRLVLFELPDIPISTVPMPTDNEFPYVDAKDAAKYLGVSVYRVYQYIHNGQLPAKKWGSNWAFLPADLSAFNEKPRKAGRPVRKGK